jgi:hypothetical protein
VDRRRFAPSAADWAAVDLEAAARAAFAYLPAAAAIRVKVYPAIKPQPNTFVFETRTDPAIFFYLDPEVTAAKFHNTLVHEFHHIGIGGICPETPDTADAETALAWVGGFAVGRAMLAAAGAPYGHPHATSDSSERVVWDRDVARVSQDLPRLEEFFLAVADGRLRGDEQNRAGMAFINTDTVPQGPFYTVGYIMARTVESELGRDRLVRSSCDQLAFLAEYNEAAASYGRRTGESLPLWSATLLKRLQPAASAGRARQDS